MLENIRPCLQSSQAGLRNLHILGIVAAADADAADDALSGLDGITAAKDDQAVSFDDTEPQGFIALDEIEPLVRRQAREANRRIRLVLGNLYAQEWRAVHPLERFERATLIAYRDNHSLAHCLRLRLCRLNDALRRLKRDTGLLERVFRHSTCPFYRLPVCLL